MSAIAYKGYTAHVEFDAADGLFVGRLAGVNDVVGFHAETVEDLKQAFHEAVEDYIATCASISKTPEKPYSGKMMVRVAPEIHAQAALAAQLSGRSLNRWTEEALKEAARRTISGVVEV